MLTQESVSIISSSSCGRIFSPCSWYCELLKTIQKFVVKDFPWIIHFSQLTERFHSIYSSHFAF